MNIGNRTKVFVLYTLAVASFHIAGAGTSEDKYLRVVLELEWVAIGIFLLICLRHVSQRGLMWLVNAMSVFALANILFLLFSPLSGMGASLSNLIWFYVILIWALLNLVGGVLYFVALSTMVQRKHGWIRNIFTIAVIVFFHLGLILPHAIVGLTRD